MRGEMHIIFFVEELSMEKALNHLLPKLLQGDVEYQIITFQCKDDMLKKLPNRLKSYTSWVNDYLFIALIDEDRQDCHVLKEKLECFARQAGLKSKTQVQSGERFRILNRIVIEELEAWFFGDVEALRAAYPKVSATLARQAGYRNPDAIGGGTWESLERVLKRNGYFRNGLAKTIAAENIAPHMEPERNRSKSFQVFCEGVYALQDQ
jgi:hypothetical protein